MIPNEEIQEIYRDTIVKWFMESAPSWKPENLGEAIWRGDDYFRNESSSEKNHQLS